jgi:hypothetical protein
MGAKLALIREATIFACAQFTLQEDRFLAKKQWNGCAGTAETILL